MLKFFIIGTICLVSLYAVDLNKQNNEINFDTLNISADEIKKSNESFLKAGAVSIRGKDTFSNQTQSLDSIVRSLPGSYTQIDQSQGGISVNLRSMTGLGRVNTMVDGVTQTFYGTSTDEGGVHNFLSDIGTSSFNTLIDTSFLIGLDVEKGSFSSSAIGLMGSANFKTINVNDVIRGNKNFGFLGKFSYGSNEVGPSYMGALAGKVNFENGSNLGILLGYGGKKIKQNYKMGNGKRIKDNLKDIDGDGIFDIDSAFNPDRLTQKPKSYLFKLDYKNEASNATLSYRKYDNYLAQRKIKSDNYQFDYRYNPYSDFIDIKFLVAYGDNKQIYDKDSRLFWASFENGMTFKNKASTFDISNTINSDILNDILLTNTFGVRYLNNEYKRETGDKDYAVLKTDYGIPDGKQKIISYYLNNKFKYNIFTFDANFNFQDWKTKGFKGECAKVNGFCFPKESGNFTKKDKNLNSSFVFSADIHDLFSPFISYSKITRAINVQELFTSGSVYQDINTMLKPEKSKTWQIGFNSFKDGLFQSNDFFGFKFVYYNTDVEDFIYDRMLLLSGKDSTLFTARMNGKAKLKGYEFEISYDNGAFYTNVSYTRQKTSMNLSDSSSIGSMFGPSSGQTQFSILPKDYATIDIGFRLFDKKLTIGTIAKYTGEAKRVDPRVDYVGNPTLDSLFGDPKIEKLPNIPTIYDLYATYKPNEQFSLKFEIQNIFDKDYMDALYTYNSSNAKQQIGDEISVFNNSARGRTFIANIEYRF
ncbi:TonB-dependent heme/hemoglobin receptor family protein [Campylobacter blaseri]|uniref:TonB-dependent receptor n=1 Tax=Campylobacter blaseri TaxID=2042961 RepID=A0A2P8R3Y5_9BACT|nr:TonB-dependent receptor [Campylobacter blaseri]PSM53227.1 TonB-dependent receptor [Campylobacter blaseri]PSM54693.1 TonB-dependent receptor [Campylobacter blaseri]QKF86825.1 TonB-dependent heme/hemoglobin receptor family protein [Campylobacter blaseri]